MLAVLASLVDARLLLLFINMFTTPSAPLNKIHNQPTLKEIKEEK
jgi:hypothetical protein